MKKRGFLFLFALVLLCISTCFSLAESKLLKIEGYVRDFTIKTDRGILTLKDNPVVIQDRIYLPLRNIAEALDYQVEWYQDTQTVSLEKPSFQEILPPTNPYAGEYFVYGEIRGIYPEKPSINIEQHIDDNSKEVFDALYLEESAVLLLQRNSHFMRIAFEDLKVGDVVGLIITKENRIRGIIVDS